MLLWEKMYQTKLNLHCFSLTAIDIKPCRIIVSVLSMAMESLLGKQGQVMVRWEGMPHTDYFYTVFWCQYDADMNCQEGVGNLRSS